jgi:hypothetical protein
MGELDTVKRPRPLLSPELTLFVAEDLREQRRIERLRAIVVGWFESDGGSRASR